MGSFWEKLDGHKTKLGNSLLLLATNMPPGKAQTYVLVAGSLLTGVGVADIFKKVILGKK